MAFEHVAGNSLNYDHNSYDRQGTCAQTVLRFQISLREMFSQWICLELLENEDKSVAVQIPALFVNREHVDP